MSVTQSVLFGLLQGVSEFLPISSSGHLAVLKFLFDLEEVPLLFDVLLHAATLVVVIAVFRRRLALMAGSCLRLILGRRDETDALNLRLCALLLVATACTGVAGLPLASLDLASRPLAVSLFFLVTAVLLIASSRLRGDCDLSQTGIRQAVMVGLAQGIGVLPGVSRSGITITAALAAGLNRRDAGEFSFLLSIPAILGALVLELRDFDILSAAVAPGALAAGMAAAGLSGFFSLRLLLMLVRRARMHYFAFYLIPLGVAGIIFLR